MVSKTSLLPLIRAFDWRAVNAGLAEKQALAAYRDERGRNWLHILCSTELMGRDPADSLKTAGALLAHGIDLKDYAFTDGDWKATPVWCCVAFGRNLALAEHLITLGADPNHSLFAASWNDDAPAIDLLVRHGADLEEFVEGGTPFLGAIGWSRFDCAVALAGHGANVNALDEKGRNALIMMLDKASGYEAVEKISALGVRADVPGPDGGTAIGRMLRKKDPRFRELAKRLA